ncbi:hypothetical protein KIPB_010461, partial [Kipferlia bialata]
ALTLAKKLKAQAKMDDNPEPVEMAHRMLNGSDKEKRDAALRCGLDEALIDIFTRSLLSTVTPPTPECLQVFGGEITTALKATMDGVPEKGLLWCCNDKLVYALASLVDGDLAPSDAAVFMLGELSVRGNADLVLPHIPSFAKRMLNTTPWAMARMCYLIGSLNHEDCIVNSGEPLIKDLLRGTDNFNARGVNAANSTQEYLGRPDRLD